MFSPLRCNDRQPNYSLDWRHNVTTLSAAVHLCTFAFLSHAIPSRFYAIHRYAIQTHCVSPQRTAPSLRNPAMLYRKALRSAIPSPNFSPIRFTIALINVALPHRSIPLLLLALPGKTFLYRCKSLPCFTVAYFLLPPITFPFSSSSSQTMRPMPEFRHCPIPEYLP